MRIIKSYLHIIGVFLIALCLLQIPPSVQGDVVLDSLNATSNGSHAFGDIIMGGTLIYMVFSIPPDVDYVINSFTMKGNCINTCPATIHASLYLADTLPQTRIADLGTIQMFGFANYTFIPPNPVILSKIQQNYAIVLSSSGGGSWYDTAFIPTGIFSFIEYGWYQSGVYIHLGSCIFSLDASPYTILDAPNLISPPHRTHTTNTIPTFFWTAVDDAEVYQFMLYLEDRSFVFRQQRLGTAYTPTTPIAANQYVWRVRAKGEINKWGKWSRRYTLFVE
jgi:hypothetical protein